jgi:hypothetical protein
MMTECNLNIPMWKCVDCDITVYRNPDDSASESWTENLDKHHETEHAKQLAEHHGDRDAMQLRMAQPGLAHARGISPIRLDRADLPDGSILKEYL